MFKHSTLDGIDPNRRGLGDDRSLINATCCYYWL
jgi:hypothetical protein